MILYAKEYLNIITSEYRDSPKFMKLMEELLTMVSNNAKCLNALDESLELDNAIGNQLDILGNIVGANRQLSFQPESGSAILDDEDYRFLIKSKIAQNNWDGTIENLSSIWDSMFPDSNLIIYDNQDMTVTMLLLASMSSMQIEMLNNNLLLPKPGGVSYNYTFVTKTLFAYNLDTSQYGGYNKGYWEGNFKIFAFDMESAIFGGWEEADWA